MTPPHPNQVSLKMGSVAANPVATTSNSKTFPAPDPNPPHPYAYVQISASVRGSELNSGLFLPLSPLSRHNGLSPSTLQRQQCHGPGQGEGNEKPGRTWTPGNRVVTTKLVPGITVNEPRLQTPGSCAIVPWSLQNRS